MEHCNGIRGVVKLCDWWVHLMGQSQSFAVQSCPAQHFTHECIYLQLNLFHLGFTLISGFPIDRRNFLAGRYGSCLSLLVSPQFLLLFHNSILRYTVVYLLQHQRPGFDSYVKALRWVLQHNRMNTQVGLEGIRKRLSFANIQDNFHYFLLLPLLRAGYWFPPRKEALQKQPRRDPLTQTSFSASITTNCLSCYKVTTIQIPRSRGKFPSVQQIFEQLKTFATALFPAGYISGCYGFRPSLPLLELYLLVDRKAQLCSWSRWQTHVNAPVLRCGRAVYGNRAQFFRPLPFWQP